ncbi:MAG: LysR family transcriptional regulator [Pseudomonadota bacterium]
MNLKTFDLNLLPVLDALLGERSVTRAAQRLHLSQPAVSNALARLRSQTGDAILVRGASGLMPTPRAEAMATSIRQILENIESTFTPAAFDPQTHEQTFYLMMNDYVELLLLPQLMAEISQVGPGIKLSVQSLAPDLASEGLVKGTLDLAFGYLGEIAEQLYRKPLMQESFVCLARQDHPRIKGELSLAQFLAEDHILVSPQGRGFVGLVDTLLGELGQKRKVVLSIPHFTVAPDIIIHTDLLMTMTKSTAQKFASHYPIQVLSVPLEIPSYAISQAWHARTQNEPSQRWLRGVIESLAKRIADRSA